MTNKALLRSVTGSRVAIVDNSAAALYQQQTSLVAHDPKPAVNKAGQLIFPQIISTQEEQKQK